MKILHTFNILIKLFDMKSDMKQVEYFTIHVKKKIILQIYRYEQGEYRTKY
jgi:hypothetical protein